MFRLFGELFMLTRRIYLRFVFLFLYLVCSIFSIYWDIQIYFLLGCLRFFFCVTLAFDLLAVLWLTSNGQCSFGSLGQGVRVDIPEPYQ